MKFPSNVEELVVVTLRLWVHVRLLIRGEEEEEENAERYLILSSSFFFFSTKKRRYML